MKANPLLLNLKTIWGRVRRLNYKHVLTDIVLITVSLYASLFLRVGDDTREFLSTLNWLLPLFLVIRLATFTVLGVYDIIWRYVSFGDSLRLARGVLISSVLILAASYMVDIGRLPRAVFVIDTGLIALFLSGARFFRRFLYENSSGKRLREEGRRTLIYGAGRNGRTVATRFNTDEFLGFNLVGFIDDNTEKVGRQIDGVKVLGTRHELAELLESMNIRELVVAIQSPSGELLRELVQVCHAQNIRPRIMSGSNLSGKPGAEVVREIGLHELLNRSRRNIPVTALRDIIQNKRVLVTGAGGSIGSEIARQIYALNPSTLLLLDHSEFNLYQIDSELRVSTSETGQIIPLLVDIKDRQVLRNTFREFLPDVIFHAAAYKHVHLVESNPAPAIINNIYGMQNLLDMSEDFGVGTFVLISTDKAVNPAGMMGATKRICELMLSAAGRRTGKRYCAVRFGNVLGSSGSLIPLLQKQIASGGPVTITHKDMTRYFMLIPEAVSLVLRAGSIAKPSDIMLLKMGEPVRILDIARSMIALMGKTKEVSIAFTGIRPGEKLFEELYLCGDEINTDDPDILVLPRGDGASIPDDRLRKEIERIVELAHEGSKDAIYRVKALIHLAQNGVDTDLRPTLSDKGYRPPGTTELLQ